MSDIYLTEPPTEGKVLVKTNQGDIDIELWPKEAPLACRNFIQLSLEGYYDNCLFHRIVKEFMVQTGDPSGTGSGGKSMWGRPFKDEYHGRIKFNHRGQVAMANDNKPHTNQSQFFITLGPCEWVNRKHTIFGKVTGNTIFNVLRMGDVEVDERDRPIDPITILSVEVLWNPFDDIVPRDLSKVADSGKVESAKLEKADKGVKAVKDKRLLSFGSEEEETGDISIAGKIHSSHDSKQKSEKMSSKVAKELLPLVGTGRSQTNTSSSSFPVDRAEGIAPSTEPRSSVMNSEVKADGFAEAMRLKILQKQRQKIASTGGMSASTSILPLESEPLEDNVHAEGQLSSESVFQAECESAAEAKAKQRSDEFNQMKEDLLRSRRAVQVITGADAMAIEKEVAEKELTSHLEQRRQKYIKRKREFGERSEETFEKLKKFTSEFRRAKSSQPLTTLVEAEVYHGQVLEKSEESDDDDLSNWNSGKLKFKKHIDDKFRNGQQLGGDGRSAVDYDVIDPRNR